MSTENTTDEAALPPVPCSACAAAIEASELRWVKCGGLSVGTYRQPMVWRLRDKYSSNVIQQNAKYSQRLAAAARLVHALKDHVTDPEMLERMERFLKPNAAVYPPGENQTPNTQEDE